MDIAYEISLKEPASLDFQTSLEVSFEVLSLEFNKEKYERITEVFQNIGKLTELKSELIEKHGNKNVVIQILHHEDDLLKSIDLIETSPNIQNEHIINTAHKSLERGLSDEVVNLVVIALKQGWSGYGLSSDKLISLVVDTYDYDSLENLCDHVIKNNDRRTALFMIEHLKNRHIELAGKLLENNIFDVEINKIAQVAYLLGSKSFQNAINLCTIRIERDIRRSHVYYHQAIRLLNVIRDICISQNREKIWEEYQVKFKEKNKGKKKLMGMMEEKFA